MSACLLGFVQKMKHNNADTQIVMFSVLDRIVATWMYSNLAVYIHDIQWVQNDLNLSFKAKL